MSPSLLLQGLGSQGLSSLGNFLLVIVVARSSSPEEFGAFAIVYSLSLLALTTFRGALGEALSVTIGPGVDGRDALGASVIVGVVTGMLLAAVGLLLPVGLVRPWLLIFGVGLPFLIVQDMVRFVGFATHRASLAVRSDAIWLAIQVLGWIMLSAAGMAAAPALVVVWWSAAGVAAVSILPSTGSPAPRRGYRWLSDHRRLVLSFGTEAMLSVGSTQAAVYAVGLSAGLPAAGALRGAESLYGPVRSGSAGIASVALPEARRRLVSGGPSTMRRYLDGLTTWVSGIGCIVAVALSVLPDPLGRALLDENWTAAATVMPAVGVSLVAGLMMTGPRLGLHAAQATRAIVRLRLTATTLSLVLSIAGAVLGGLIWAAWALALARVVTAALSWVMLHREVPRARSLIAANPTGSSDPPHEVDS